MKNPSLSLKIYIGLVITLAISAAINIFLPQGSVPSFELPASKPIIALANAGIMLFFYGGLGLIGLILSQKLGFADIWDPKVSTRQRLLIPALVGAGIGIFIILSDLFFSRYFSIGPIPHPPFPTSIFGSISAGIGEEIIFRLFFISLWVWLISHVILKKKWQNQVFWIIAGISALAFAVGHVPSVMFLFGYKTINDIPLALLTEIILLNGVVSIFAAYYFRKFGFLAAVGIHFWTDIVWHVIWGVI